MEHELMRFECPACGVGIDVPAHLAGRRGRCETCGQLITIPEPGAGASAASAAPPVAAGESALAEDDLIAPVAPANVRPPQVSPTAFSQALRPPPMSPPPPPRHSPLGAAKLPVMVSLPAPPPAPPPPGTLESAVGAVVDDEEKPESEQWPLEPAAAGPVTVADAIAAAEALRPNPIVPPRPAWWTRPWLVAGVIGLAFLSGVGVGMMLPWGSGHAPAPAGGGAAAAGAAGVAPDPAKLAERVAPASAETLAERAERQRRFERRETLMKEGCRSLDDYRECIDELAGPYTTDKDADGLTTYAWTYGRSGDLSIVLADRNGEIAYADVAVHFSDRVDGPTGAGLVLQLAGAKSKVEIDGNKLRRWLDLSGSVEGSRHAFGDVMLEVRDVKLAGSDWRAGVRVR